MTSSERSLGWLVRKRTQRMPPLAPLAQRGRNQAQEPGKVEVARIGGAERDPGLAFHL